MSLTSTWDPGTRKIPCCCRPAEEMQGMKHGERDTHAQGLTHAISSHARTRTLYIRTCHAHTACTCAHTLYIHARPVHTNILHTCTPTLHPHRHAHTHTTSTHAQAHTTSTHAHPYSTSTHAHARSTSTHARTYRIYGCAHTQRPPMHAQA